MQTFVTFRDNEPAQEVMNELTILSAVMDGASTDNPGLMIPNRAGCRILEISAILMS
jgi:hypothetical protein